MILDHLALAERHVAEGQAHIESQIMVIRKLRERGHDTGEADALLATFLVSQSHHLADRDRILEELAQISG